MKDCVFLFDVDNTLLDNDRVQADLSEHLAEAYGPATRDRYWAIFEQLRSELGYADYLGALERYRTEDMHNPKVLLMACWFAQYPFADRLYPGAMDAVRRAREAGEVCILSDGDAVFQPQKIARAGLRGLFEDHVLIYIHKEQELDDVERWRPARRYVMVDDKLRLLTAIKAIWRERVTTVWVKQGHYATDPAATAGLPAADVTIERIADFAQLDLPALATLRQSGA
jgi:beta-phosphoglucomutase-like phosphatase (HAD superfamily)